MIFLYDPFSGQNYSDAENHRLDGTKYPDIDVLKRHFLSLYQRPHRQMGFGYPCRYRPERLLGGMSDDGRQSGGLYSFDLSFQQIRASTCGQTENKRTVVQEFSLV